MNGVPNPFVGRAAELAAVVQHANRPRAEGPGIVVVDGAAGMGRTAFLARVAGELRKSGHLVLTPAAGPQGPFGLANRLLAALRGHGTGTNTGEPCAPGDLPHAAGQRLLTALAAAAAGGRPITVVIDDVQHADFESSLALGFAARRLYGQPVQFVLSVRTSDGDGQDPNVRRIMPVRGDVLHLRLTGLTVAEIQSLGEAFGVAPLRRADARLIRGHSEGNPRDAIGLLEEIRRDPHARSGQPLVPRSSSTSINDQLGGLPAASRALVEALAVLEERCPLSSAATVAGVTEPLPALEPLLAAGLAEWWPAEPTTPVRISTPLRQQAVYQALPAQLRRVLHRRAASVLPFDRALPHRMSAAAGRPDPVLAADLADASWRWIAEGNLDRAAQYLLWAADATEPGEKRDRRLLFGVSLLQRAARYEAADAQRDRVRACGPSALRSCVAGRFAMIDGDAGAARELLESAVTEAERDPSAPEFGAVAALAYTWLALLHGWFGESSEALAAARRCLEVSPFGRRIDRSAELVYLSACCELDGPVAALRGHATLVTLPAGPDQVDPGDTLLLLKRGHLRLLAGEPAEAVADLETGLRKGRESGITDIDDWAHFWAAGAHAVLGAWDRALEHTTAALEIATADNRPHLASMFALAGYVEANAGELAAAVEHANAAADFAEHFALPNERMLPALATAAIAQVRGDPLGAVEALRPFAGPVRGWQRVYRWLWWPIYLDALIDLGRVDDAAAGLVAVAGDIDDGYRVLVVPQLYLTGRAAEAAGDPVAARTAYQRAMDAAPALGNREWRARAATAQARLASEPTEAAAELVDLLTERERTIAGLIADGLSNKAVSGYLGITEKTIEAHLTRVYRKLSVKSRGELRLAMAPCARSGSQLHQNTHGNA